MSRLTPGLLAALFVLTAACKSKEAKPAPTTPEPEARAEQAEQAQPPAGDTKLDGSPWPYGQDARLFDTPAQALAAVLEQEPRILGIGEFHKLQGSAPVDSALRRFASEMIDELGPKTAHLVLETWRVEPGCGETGKKVETQVKQTIERPPETESEMDILMKKSEQYGIKGHVLGFACDEYEALLGDQGLDHEKLLKAIAKKLGEAGVMAAQHPNAAKPISVLYGGATHNDLVPYEGLEPWSYAKAVDEAAGGGFVELDLYVPEFVEGNELLKNEPWYGELMGEVRNDKVILIQRSDKSYIMLMRKGYSSEPAPPVE